MSEPETVVRVACMVVGITLIIGGAGLSLLLWQIRWVLFGVGGGVSVILSSQIVL